MARPDRGGRSGGGPSGPRRAPPGGGPRQQPTAQDHAKKYGLPLDLARLVAAGQLTPSEAIERLARRDQVEQLMRQHELDRALATQIALGHARLDDVLARRRIQVHLDANRDQEVFHDYATSGAPIVLGLHGHRIVRGVIGDVRAYEFDFTEEGAAAAEVIHKTAVKYAYPPDEYKKLKKAMEVDKARRERAIDPRLRPQDRFACSNRRLGAAQDAQRDVHITLLEGEIFSGKIARVSRYEVLLRTKQGAEVVLLRHAFDDFQEG